MNILHLCPPHLATGGTEGIHNLVSELRNCGANAKILYTGMDLHDPQPEAFMPYACPYITKFPEGYTGVVIFPEVWGNRVIDPHYKDCITVINWQGIDVYNWHTLPRDRGLFLQNKNTLHITMSEYGMEYLRGLGLSPMKIPDCLNDAYFQLFEKEAEREDVILYNPTEVKMTWFQRDVMAKCQAKYGAKFLPLIGYTQEELINIFRHSKLYIDFGVFSGRERLPREAVMCGCCILTSRNGTAGYYEDNTIPDKYKLNNIDDAVTMVRYVLNNYEQCKSDFDMYKQALRKDKLEYPGMVRRFYRALLNYNSST